MIRICIFDLDGTTVNSLKSIAHFANETLVKFGFEPFDTDDYRHLAGGGAKKLMTNLINARGGNIALLDDMVNDWLNRYEKNAFYLTEPYAGINNMLSSLKQMGIITAIVTNKNERVASSIIKHSFGAPGELIDYYVCEHPGMVLKPQPDELINVCKKYSVPLDCAVYIGDHNIDMTTGKNAHMKCCGVTWGFHTEEELIAAGADFIADKPSDIIEFVKNNI